MVVWGQFDERDGPVLPPPTSDGSCRAPTPTSLARAVTPTKMRSVPNRMPQYIAPVVRGTGKVGRRKQRRWENDNFINLRVPQGDSDTPYLEMKSLALNVEFRSNFSRMFEQENRDALSTFLTSKEKPTSPPGPSVKRVWQDEEWNVAEARFSCVDRRARACLSATACPPNGVHVALLLQLQQLVVNFAEHGSLGEVAGAVESALCAPASVEQQQQRRQQQQQQGGEDGPGGGLDGDGVLLLLLPLASSVHRLLAHGLCQYLQLPSRSEDRKGNRVLCVVRRGATKAVTAANAETEAGAGWAGAGSLPLCSYLEGVRARQQQQQQQQQQRRQHTKQEQQSTTAAVRGVGTSGAEQQQQQQQQPRPKPVLELSAAAAAVAAGRLPSAGALSGGGGAGSLARTFLQTYRADAGKAGGSSPATAVGAPSAVDVPPPPPGSSNS